MIRELAPPGLTSPSFVGRRDDRRHPYSAVAVRLYGNCARRILRTCWLVALLTYIVVGGAFLIMSALVPLIGALITLPLLIITRAVAGIPSWLVVFFGVDEAALGVYYLRAPHDPLPGIPHALDVPLFWACLLWPIGLGVAMIVRLRPPAATGVTRSSEA